MATSAVGLGYGGGGYDCRGPEVEEGSREAGEETGHRPEGQPEGGAGGVLAAGLPHTQLLPAREFARHEWPDRGAERTAGPGDVQR